MDHRHGVDKPVTRGSPEIQKLKEELEREELQGQSKKLAYEEKLAEIEASTKNRVGRGRVAKDKIDRMFEEAEVELSGPHILETMRGLLAEL